MIPSQSGGTNSSENSGKDRGASLINSQEQVWEEPERGTCVNCVKQRASR